MYQRSLLSFLFFFVLMNKRSLVETVKGSYKVEESYSGGQNMNKGGDFT